MRLGLLGYTNTTSGCGVVAAALLKWCKVDSILSMPTPKGQERWLDRQFTLTAQLTEPVLVEYIEHYRPHVLVSIETAFNDRVVNSVCREMGVVTANIVMHESYRAGADDPDLFICPVRVAYDKVGAPNKVYFDLPFDIDGFKFKTRKAARRFLHVMGYGAAYNRRQTREVVAGFLLANLPDSTLTVHCQQNPAEEYGWANDPRVVYRIETLPTPADIYDGFDVLVQPDAYAGFNLPMLEAKACGLPVITTDAPPMNELVRDPDALVDVARTDTIDPAGGNTHGLNTTRYLVSAQGVADTLRRVAASDIKSKSRRARACAESHAWTDSRAADFLRLLEASLW